MSYSIADGAEPVDALRDALREKLKTVIKTARRRIQQTYTEQENKDKSVQGIHHDAEQITADLEKVSPKARAGAKVDPQDKSGQTPWTMAMGMIPLAGAAARYDTHQDTADMLEKMGAKRRTREDLAKRGNPGFTEEELVKKANPALE